MVYMRYFTANRIVKTRTPSNKIETLLSFSIGYEVNTGFKKKLHATVFELQGKIKKLKFFSNFYIVKNIELTTKSLRVLLLSKLKKRQYSNIKKKLFYL